MPRSQAQRQKSDAKSVPFSLALYRKEKPRNDHIYRLQGYYSGVHSDLGASERA